jgi:hypothetical protein
MQEFPTISQARPLLSSLWRGLWTNSYTDRTAGDWEGDFDAASDLGDERHNACPGRVLRGGLGQLIRHCEQRGRVDECI